MDEKQIIRKENYKQIFPTEFSKYERFRMLSKEISKIHNHYIQKFTIDVLSVIPNYFFYLPASSTGKYHNIVETQRGGLVIHTKSVVMALDTLLSIDIYRNMAEQSGDNIDAMYSACILHDIGKYGFKKQPAQHTLFNHPVLGGDFIANYAKEQGINEPWIYQIVNNVKRHHGQWNETYYTGKRYVLPKPQTNSDILVHTADVFASRRYISFLEDKWL